MKAGIFVQFLILSLYLAGVILANTAGQTPECRITLTDDNKGSEVCLRKGDKICLKLEARLATGFSWGITKTDTKLLKLVSMSTEKTGEDEAGTELQIFNFEAISEGEVTLELGYARPWEKDKPPAKKYNVNIKIN